MTHIRDGPLDNRGWGGLKEFEKREIAFSFARFKSCVGK